MSGPESVIPKRFQRLTKPLSEAELKNVSRSALAGSFAEARREIKSKDIKYPIQVIPQGEYQVTRYMAQSEKELKDIFRVAKKEAWLGKVHLIGRPKM